MLRPLKMASSSAFSCGELASLMHIDIMPHGQIVRGFSEHVLHNEFLPTDPYRVIRLQTLTLAQVQNIPESSIGDEWASAAIAQLK